jgi:hypothetical protein
LLVGSRWREPGWWQHFGYIRLHSCVIRCDGNSVQVILEEVGVNIEGDADWDPRTVPRMAY